MTLNDFFGLHPRAGIAFSGGVDSAYLLYAAIQSGARVKAYYVKSAFQPAFELEDAKKIAERIRADMTVIDLDVLDCERIAANPPDRCYHCKRRIFSAIVERANADGFDTLFDGTNASDDAGDRPGMRALRELKVLSPLRECGLTKPEIRERSKEAGLFTWNKPAYACLATRIRTGEVITREKLEKTELAEGYLYSLGFSDFRVRMAGGAARIQVTPSQIQRVLTLRNDILSALKKYYDAVTLDLEVRDE
ncbi:MAG: ATP-dependent sacrificial sulfur transferase LarE [Clostridia bacterium]|nr:ATP-dependent sacrificial sulfur transferase LarE [Clostridia bacterium]